MISFMKRNDLELTMFEGIGIRCIPPHPMISAFASAYKKSDIAAQLKFMLGTQTIIHEANKNFSLHANPLNTWENLDRFFKEQLMPLYAKYRVSQILEKITDPTKKEKFIKLLESKQLNTAYFLSLTALHVAIIHGNTEIARELESIVSSEKFDRCFCSGITINELKAIFEVSEPKIAPS